MVEGEVNEADSQPENQMKYLPALLTLLISLDLC